MVTRPHSARLAVRLSFPPERTLLLSTKQQGNTNEPPALIRLRM